LRGDQGEDFTCNARGQASAGPAEKGAVS